MKIYNSMTRSKEEFKPIEPNKVKIYLCGPTVYNYIHIGNARPVCAFDVLRRYLEFKGYEVTFVSNLTDIDDKIINKANAEGTDYKTVSEKYIAEFQKDCAGLNVLPPTISPKATETMEEIISIISDLVEKGFAYKTENGDVYFSTNKFDEYGKLSHQPLEDLRSGARINPGEEKREPVDFAVWKSAKPGEPYWESPWGKGRPGWHIECSAMVRKHLGNTIDIHGGGQDLIFPHHENEIAQSECCNSEPFANYWMHNGYLNIDNKKMSKSDGNFLTVRDIAEKYGYEPIRYIMVSAHYRNPLNYSMQSIEQAIASLERLYNCRENLMFLTEKAADGEKEGECEIFNNLLVHREKFISAMDDDLNMADAVSAIFDLARDINSNINTSTNPSKELCVKAQDLFMSLCDVLGILYTKAESNLDSEIEELIEKRETARKNKDWATADAIRDELTARNIVLEDTPSGIKWRVVS